VAGDPLLPGKFTRDASGTKAVARKAEGDDSLLQAGADVVRRPRTAVLAEPQCLEAPAVDAVVAPRADRVVNSQPPARRPDADRRFARKQLTTIAELHIIL